MKIVNTDLIIHPVNWVIIFLVLYLGALLAKMVYNADQNGVSPIPFPKG